MKLKIMRKKVLEEEGLIEVGLGLDNCELCNIKVSQEHNSKLRLGKFINVIQEHKVFEILDE